ncbi:hypothetical protein V8G54_022221, partial [Vigna mungo]
FVHSLEATIVHLLRTSSLDLRRRGETKLAKTIETPRGKRLYYFKACCTRFRYLMLLCLRLHYVMVECFPFFIIDLCIPLSAFLPFINDFPHTQRHHHHPISTL